MATTFPISLLDATRSPVSADMRFAPPAQSDPDDLLAQAQAGNPDAFAQLYFRHKKRVFSICFRMVHDVSLAEDLTQETFFRLHRNLTSFRGTSAFTTWLHRITVNVVLMHLRKRALPVVSLDEMATDVPEERAGRGFGACDLTQAGVVDRLAIERAVAALAPGYRTIYLLHDVEGFQHHEIASMYRCSLGTSKSQLHKARRALRSALSPQSDSAISRLRGSKPASRHHQCILSPFA